MSHIVAIDGPAGAGKSTVARRVAVSLGFAFVDTGAIYRTVALAALKEHIALHDGAALAAMTTRLKMHFETKQDGNLVFLEGEDVTAKIRSREVSTAASSTSTIPSRDGLMPTPLSSTSLPSIREAATSQNAAEETSPGTTNVSVGHLSALSSCASIST